LRCWCAPERCHAAGIARYLNRRLGRQEAEVIGEDGSTAGRDAGEGEMAQTEGDGRGERPAPIVACGEGGDAERPQGMMTNRERAEMFLEELQEAWGAEERAAGRGRVLVREARGVARETARTMSTRWTQAEEARRAAQRITTRIREWEREAREGTEEERGEGQEAKQEGSEQGRKRAREKEGEGDGGEARQRERKRRQKPDRKRGKKTRSAREAEARERDPGRSTPG
jgi:hypothetical protein